MCKHVMHAAAGASLMPLSRGADHALQGCADRFALRAGTEAEA